MSMDKSSLSTEVQHNKPSQTANTSIDNQDIKKDDLVAANDDHDNSSSLNTEVAHESHQTTTLDRNKNDDTSTTESKSTNNELAKASTSPFLDPSPNSSDTRTLSSNENNSPPLDAQTTTTPKTSITQSPDLDANKHGSEISNHEPQTLSPPKTTPTLVTKTSTTQIPNSDTNKQSTTSSANDHMNSLPTAENPTSKIRGSDANKEATHDSPKSSTTKDPSSNEDSNFLDQTNPPTANNDTKQATNQSTYTGQQPRNESSTSHIPDKDAKQDNVVASDASPKISTTKVPDSSQDANIIDETNPPIVDGNTNQATNKGTKMASADPQTSKYNNGNSLPTDNPSTSQLPASDANKHGDTITVADLPKSSTNQVPTSNQDVNSDDQANPPTSDIDPKKETDLGSTAANTDPKTDDQKPSSETTHKVDRKQLENLIDQELKIVKRICPKLGEHGKTIMEEAEKVFKRYDQLKNENCELKELKSLKKTVTKLKLQIPPRYMTFDESDKQKMHLLGVESSDNIPIKLQKRLPRLHDKLFHHSPICKSIHLRFNALSGELKLCLLCFTVFPENAIISRRSMIYWWIGEGLIPGGDDTAEERANDYFKKLMGMDFIEPVAKRFGLYVANCQMNPMVRAALVMIADEVKFFDFDKYGNPKDFGKFDEIESPEDLPVIYPLGEPREFFSFFNEKGKSISEQIDYFDPEGNPCQFAARPLDGQKPVNRNRDPIDIEKKYYLYQRKRPITKSYKVCLMGSGLSKGIPWENLHMMFNVQDVILEFKPEWFLRMKNIKVLVLGTWQSSASHHIEVEEFEFEKRLDNMNNVRFFSLQGVSRISKLPDSISKLKSLLILDLRACHNLEEIPESIGLLKRMTHLDMSECYLLKKIPKEISSLESLQVLKGFVVFESERDICTLQDLRKLENLRKLSMYTHMKNFPEESHLDALQNLEMLRKLTILWGGHEPMPETNKSKQDARNNKKRSLVSKFRSLIPQKKKWVEGSMRRMNAFSNSTLGLRLEKLDLKCFPCHETPDWLTACNLQGLKKLYIRGGHFADLGQYQDVLEWDLPKVTWNVEILRLKYLEELNIEWRELRNLFPKLKSLEKVKCPRLTLFPCNENGVWMKKGS